MPADGCAVIAELPPAQARSIIESLVDGVVPRHGAHLFTAGREKWLESLEEDLDDMSDPAAQDGRIRIFKGRNGDGKTHLMHLLQNRALRRDFAVAYVVVSEQLPLYRWDKVYAAIGQSLATRNYPDGVGFRAIFDPASPDPAIAADFVGKAVSIRSLVGIDPGFSQAVYRYCTQQTVNVDHQQDMLLLGSWLEGNPQKLKEMGVVSTIDPSNGARMLRSLVQTLCHFGFRGLNILVDEVESVMSLPTNRRRDSYQTLRLLIDRENTPAHCLLAASTTPPMFSDRERGMATYPALWSRIQPSQQSEFINYRSTLIDLTRTPLSEENYRMIGDCIRAIHDVGRGWDSRTRVTDEFIRGAAKIAASGRLTLTYSTTRVFVKLVAETLELANQYPDFETSTPSLMSMFDKTDRQLAKDREKADDL
jgi:hypothetical protein